MMMSGAIATIGVTCSSIAYGKKLALDQPALHERERDQRPDHRRASRKATERDPQRDEERARKQLPVGHQRLRDVDRRGHQVLRHRERRDQRVPTPRAPRSPTEQRRGDADELGLRTSGCRHRFTSAPARRALGQLAAVRARTAATRGSSSVRGNGSSIATSRRIRARPRRHHHHAGREEHRLVDAVGDERHGERLLRAIARRAPRRACCG